MVMDLTRAAREAERRALDAILGRDPVARARELARDSLFGLRCLVARALEHRDDIRLRRTLALLKRAERLVREDAP